MIENNYQTEIMLRFAGRVRVARADLGMSGQELADALGCTPQYVSRIESGRVNVTLKKAASIAFALNRELHELLGGPFVIEGSPITRRPA